MPPYTHTLTVCNVYGSLRSTGAGVMVMVVIFLDRLFLSSGGSRECQWVPVLKGLGTTVVAKYFI